MEEGSFCLIDAAYPGSGAPMDKSGFPRDLFGIFGEEGGPDPLSTLLDLGHMYKICFHSISP